MTVLTESGKGIFIAYPIMAFVATVAVVLRFVSKSRTQNKFAADDFLTLAGLSLFYAYTAVFMYGLYDSGGTLDITQMTGLDQVNAVLRWIWVSEILMTIILTFVKTSVVCWYWNIFAVNNSDIKIPMIIIGALSVAWGLAALLLVIFQCIPVSAAWDLLAANSPGSRCIAFGNLILGYEITNMLLDVAILILPLRAVFRLKLNLSKKITVASIFVLGAFVCITCIIRIVYMYNPASPQLVDLYKGMLWSSIEMGVAIFCSCLPTLGRLLPNNGILPTLSRWFKSLHSSYSSEKNSKPSFVHDTWPMNSQTNPETDSTRQLNTYTSHGDPNFLKAGQGYIQVTHQFHVKRPDVEHGTPQHDSMY
ncbi:uncharacterized protein C8A04DRAFT_28491 [Dichotomopilus funicola]|uniref:Rhodopsin domain-containing protein n=1 Tax=Dichotomopilus funicola TaxID=1934379 RepID=A0AAN6V2V3_9PEZI|nr:hypothetical protein C8A04DRAFT_28491 [Dichotomopilus funicola]